MTEELTKMELVRMAASALGKKGGSSGRGLSKRRSAEHYRKMVKARQQLRDREDIERYATSRASI